MTKHSDRHYWLSTSPLPGCHEVGWVHWRRAAEQELHAHEHAFELHVFSRSAQRFRVEDEIIDVPADHAIVIPPSVMHGPTAGKVNSGECFWLRIDLSDPGFCRELPETDRMHVIDDLRRCAQYQALPIGSDGVEAFRRLVDRHQDDGVHNRHLAHAALIEVVTSLCMALAPMNQRPDFNRLSPEIARAARRLKEAVGTSIAIETLATEAGLGMRTFHKRFVAEIGYTPGQYRVRCRLDWAEKMLLETSRSITDIALNAGFASSQYFATVFRRHVGVSPQSFRNRAH
jgi:AraC-like DNA-binding protein